MEGKGRKAIGNRIGEAVRLLATGGIRKVTRDRRSLTGFTLIEIAISSVVFVAVMLLATQFLRSSEETYRVGAAIEDLEVRGRRILDEIATGLVQAKVINVSGTHTSIQFQVPVDHDNDNDVVDNNNLVEYGYADPSTDLPMLGWSAAYTFLPGDVLSEAADQIDYNRDNDLLDTLSRGSIERIVYDTLGAQVSRVEIDANVILNNAPMDGDVNGNNPGVQDPVFYRTDGTGTEQPLTGNVVQINIWHIKVGEKGETYIRNNKQRVMLINPQ